ncbi:hypothetical protein HN695_03420 [Candidatus Woesearchaeota archaeon]|jgi:small subunit ribosomal protein S3Ae|nr:hypothetical protein [Candidatus Woesearchaeota archaeon]MBT5272980.1 hypothetical protein [Candidatus Woesearchaeota archaeon]MBT6041446.1 hypothetical protein [Candidatus Woesearchaeota archaeon]MBT6336471.1 hypothetical protein [Candidatus Woesearchaeota archaeon]MBT7927361.1 hypothetical protein [Candidatus Woesearchaeota archaeon]
MAKAKKTDSSVQSWKKKKWIPILSEKIYDNSIIGETPVEDPTKIIGRSTNVNMMSVSGDMKKQNISIMYKIHNHKENKFYAVPIGYKTSPAYIKRLVRRGRDRIDASFLVKTKDDIVVRVKVILLTKALVYRSSRSQLKKLLEYECGEHSVKLDFYQFFNDVLNNRFQNKTRSMLSKVYPLRTFLVKEINLEEKIDPKDVSTTPFKGLKKIQEKHKRSMEKRQQRREEGGDRRPHARGPHRPPHRPPVRAAPRPPVSAAPVTENKEVEKPKPVEEKKEVKPKEEAEKKE